MKPIFPLFIVFILLQTIAVASGIPEQTFVKSYHSQLTYSKLQINDSINEKTDSFSYYEGQYFNAKKRRNGGIFLTVFGLGGFIAGSLIAIENKNDDEKESLGGVGTGIFITATVMTSIGIPLWISGSSRMKKNKTILEKIEEKPVSLRLTSSNYGIGLSLNF